MKGEGNLRGRVRVVHVALPAAVATGASVSVSYRFTEAESSLLELLCWDSAVQTVAASTPFPELICRSRNAQANRWSLRDVVLAAASSSEITYSPDLGSRVTGAAAENVRAIPAPRVIMPGDTVEFFLTGGLAGDEISISVLTYLVIESLS